jgi:hypothetical protein
MHIITGLLLAALAGRKRGTSTGGMTMPSGGPVRTEHVLPGRIRFRVPSLANDFKTCKALASRVTGLEGITRTAVNPVSGSVLISYEEGAVRPEILYGVLVKLLGLEEELERTPQSVVARELSLLGGSFDRAVYEKSNGLVDGWSLLMLGLAGLGIRQIINNGARALPTGVTMVWWALNGLNRKRG